MSFVGSFVDQTEAAIKNDYSKKFCWIYAGNERRFQSGVLQSFVIADENGNAVLKLTKKSSDEPLIESKGTLPFWDFTANDSAAIKVKHVQVTEIYRDDYGGNFANFTPPSPVKGKFFFAEDTNASNPGKRMYVCLDGSSWSYVDLT